MHCLKCELPGDWVIEVRLPDGRGYKAQFCEAHKIEAIADLESRGFIGQEVSSN